MYTDAERAAKCRDYGERLVKFLDRVCINSFGCLLSNSNKRVDFFVTEVCEDELRVGVCPHLRCGYTE